MPRSWAVAGSAAVGLVLAFGLAGCAPEPIPPVPTTDRPSPTVEPTPTPTPEPAPETVHPQRPAAMESVDAAGAEAAVEYFLSLYPYAQATGDLDEWVALSHPECVFCQAFIQRTNERFDMGRHGAGGLTSISDVTSHAVDGGEAWTVAARFSQEPSTSLDADGNVAAEYPGVVYDIAAFVVHDGDQWWIREFSYEDVE